MYLLKLSFNLLSICKGIEDGKKFVFTDHDSKILDENEKLSLLLPNLEIYIICTLKKNKCLLMQLQYVQIMILEKILGQKIWSSWSKEFAKIRENMVNGLDFDVTKNVQMENHHHSFPKYAGKKSNELLEGVYSDVCGKIKEKSLSG